MGFEELLFRELWLILPLWILLYGLDYYLTLLGAHYYRSGANKHFTTEGSYELTPQFQATIDAGKILSPQFMRASTISSAIIVPLWLVSKTDPVFLSFFKFLVGGLIVREGAVLLRHSRNIALFHHLRAHRGVSGQVRHRKWLSYRLSANELLTLAVASLLIFLLTGSIPFLGGTVVIGVTGLEHLKLSRRQLEHVPS